MAKRTPDREGASGVEIAHRDAHLLVLVKPPGIATTSPEGERGRSLATLARRIDPDAPRMHPSSRLDRDVTGLVTFARTDRAIEALLAARRAGTYGRRYVALVQGAPGGGAGGEGEWAWGIAIDPRDATRRIALDAGQTGERAQDARTRFRTIATAAVPEAVSGTELGRRDRSFSIAHLWPITGRTHQLRVHCARAGHPIAGDVTYGGPARIVLETGRVVTPRRPLLHCAMLTLPDVERGGTIDLTAPVPDDLVRAWEGLGGDRGALVLPGGGAAG